MTKKEIVEEFKDPDEEEKKQKKKTKIKIDKEKDLELTLAVSIILANLSSDDDFIRNLLAINKWKKKDKKMPIDDNANTT